MRLLDLFCGAGGAAVGYHRAGFEYIVGVDIKPQLRYPFEFVQGDALEFVAKRGAEFDLIHASPPCQAHSQIRWLWGREYPEWVIPTREVLKEIGKSYVIENVVGAPLVNPLTLCGTMFGLRVIRHRVFECNPSVWWPPFACNHWAKCAPKGQMNIFENGQFLTVTGHDFRAEEARQAMGIDWMMRDELAQAVPPAYTEWLGGQIREGL